MLNIRKRKESLSPNKRATPRTKTCTQPIKIMLCIWWNRDDVLYYELLPRGVTITADIYCQQLRRPANAFQGKRPRKLRKVMLLHNNARPHSANLAKTLYRSMIGDSFRTHLIHLILCTQTFHLFRSLSNNLEGTSFPDVNVLWTWLDDFNSKPLDFYRRGIEKLLQHW